MRTITIVLAVLPALSVLLLFVLRRSEPLSRLFPAVVVSGIAGAILSGCYAFSVSAVSIAPYETNAAWAPLAGGVLLALWIGFGLGVLTASAAGLPYWYLTHPRRRR